MSAAPSRGLKIAVISMGIALIGGFILLVGLSIAKYQQTSGKASIGSVAPEACQPATLALPAAAQYRIVAVQQQVATLQIMQEGQDDRLLQVDICNGTLLHSLAIVR